MLILHPRHTASYTVCTVDPPADLGRDRTTPYPHPAMSIDEGHVGSEYVNLRALGSTTTTLP